MKISVVTAVFNRAGTITHAVKSIQAQTYPNVEHIIQDGGSTDGTLDRILELSSDRTHLFSGSDSGIYDAINQGILNATGDVIGVMHSDDFFANDHVLEKIALAFKNSNILGVYGDLEYVSSRDPSHIIRYWRAGEYYTGLLKQGWMPPHPTLYLRREVFDKYGLYDTSFRIAADYDAILRYLMTGNVKLFYIPEVLVKMRVGGESNRSINRIIRKSHEDFVALKKNEVGGIKTLIKKNISKLNQFYKKESIENE